MPYKISERLKQDAIKERSDHMSSISKVFLFFSVLSFLTGWVFAWDSEVVVKGAVNLSQPESPYEDQDDDFLGKNESRLKTIIGPISVRKFQETYYIRIKSPLLKDTSRYVEGTVLNAEKEFLFSFGKELWYETGYDDEGAWTEVEDTVTSKIIFPTPGTYYISLKTQGDTNLGVEDVYVSRLYGSSLPHYLFAVVCFCVFFLLNKKCREFCKDLVKQDEFDD